MLCIGLCLHLGWIALQGLLDSLRTGSYDVRTFDLPKWLIYLPMVLGLWLSALEFLRFLTGRDSIYALDVREMEGFGRDVDARTVPLTITITTLPMDWYTPSPS